jgi:hypothetical protein
MVEAEACAERVQSLRETVAALRRQKFQIEQEAEEAALREEAEKISKEIQEMENKKVNKSGS